MRVNVNEQRVHVLALEYAKEGGQDYLTDLTEELNPFIMEEVRKAVLRATDTGVFIAAHDFESGYRFAVWEAAKGYNWKGEFMKRLRFFMKHREADAWRLYETEINDDQYKDGKSYDKARLDSLDKPIDDEGNTFADIVYKSINSVSAEMEYFAQADFKDWLDKFGQAYSQRYQKVIVLMHLGLTYEEISHAFGESKYNAKMRKLIERTKAAFESYAAQNMQTCKQVNK